METFLLHALALLVGIVASLVSSVIGIALLFAAGFIAEQRRMMWFVQSGWVLGFIIAPVCALAGLVGGYGLTVVYLA